MTLRLAIVSGFLATAWGLPGMATAQDPGFYAGLSAGQGRFTNGCAGLANAGFAGSCDEKDAAWKIFGGYQFNDIFAAEAGYTKLGEVHMRGTFLGVPGTAKVEASGFEMVGVARMPIAVQFAAYGKAGFLRWDVDRSGAGSSIGETGTNITLGLGFQYNVTKRLAARAEWQRYSDVGNDNTTGNSDVDVLSIGLVIKF
jgi:OOP family OmpA-OmpF porin